MYLHPTGIQNCGDDWNYVHEFELAIQGYQIDACGGYDNWSASVRREQIEERLYWAEEAKKKKAEEERKKAEKERAQGSDNSTRGSLGLDDKISAELDKAYDNLDTSDNSNKFTDGNTPEFQRQLMELYANAGINVKSIFGDKIDFSEASTYSHFKLAGDISSNFMEREMEVHKFIINLYKTGDKEIKKYAERLIQSEFTPLDNIFTDINSWTYRGIDVAFSSKIRSIGENSLSGTISFIDHEHYIYDGDKFKVVMNSLRASVHEKWHRSQFIMGYSNDFSDNWFLELDKATWYSYSEFETINTMNRIFNYYRSSYYLNSNERIIRVGDEY